MNETNSAARTPRRRRSFLWIWILLLLASFTGGIVLGLKLNTLPLPNDVQNRLYPVLEAIIPGSTAVRPQEAAPVMTPSPTLPAAPVETPAAPAPAPIETPAPAEPAPLPMEETVPIELTVPAELTVPVEGKPEPTAEPEPVEPVAVMVSDTTRYESAPKSIGVDAALEAALKYAEIEKKDAEITGVYRTKDEDGESVYEVAFKVGEISYEYIVSAADGEILGWKMSGFRVEDTTTYGAAPEPTPTAEPEK